MRRMVVAVFGMVFAAGGLGFIVGTHAQDKGDDKDKDKAGKVVRPRPFEKADGKDWEAPKEGVLYVWEVPAKGLQTVLVLRAVDGDTLECAYLVPVTVRLHGIDAPEHGTKEGKAAAAYLDGLVVGKLAGASLRGKEKYGRQLADLWLGVASKDDPKAPAGWLGKHLIDQGHAKAWTGQGPKPKQD